MYNGNCLVIKNNKLHFSPNSNVLFCSLVAIDINANSYMNYYYYNANSYNTTCQIQLPGTQTLKSLHINVFVK